MRKIIISAFAAIIISVFAAVSFELYSTQRWFDEYLYGNIIRFHIISDSNSFEDTKAKLLIKEKITDYLYFLTKDCENRENAERMLSSKLEDIKLQTQNISDRLGYDYSIDVSLSEEKYPVRIYDDFTLPGGEYCSLRIDLGSAEGKNWWCVVYPAICRCASADITCGLKRAGVPEKCAYEIENKNAKYKFYILELFKK